MKATCLILSTSLLLGSISGSCLTSASNTFNKLASFAKTDIIDAGPMETRNITVTSVTSVESATGIILKYTQADTTAVTLTAPDNIIDDVAVTEKGGHLDCRITTNRRVNKPIVVTVSSPAVTNFNSNSGAQIEINEGLNVPTADVVVSASSGASLQAKNITAANLEAKSSSGASLSIDVITASDNIDCHSSSGASMAVYSITANEVSGHSSSGASMSLTGTAETVGLQASSGASVGAKGLKAQNGDLQASSGGSVSGYVTGKCKISKSSGGSASNAAW